ncbi:hypothetical protein FHS15_003833 [Paenibacillus castaneae]|uniref:S-layer homology domain-containing protein n=1 Tax=Paenibacillus castaneae TaxID=474957 RepID=UPI000C9D08B9|nr:S-layer homology domain-containing protein [Paenibacillus castaneae]NIK78687.1 hypothetical protein [Paenibacillus castaneae]
MKLKTSSSFKKSMSMILSLVILLSCFPPIGQAEGSVNTVTSVGVSPTQITFMYDDHSNESINLRFNWITNTDIKDTVIEYAPKVYYTENHTFQYRKVGTYVKADINLGSSDPVHGHKVEISSLAADTEYVYRLGDGAENWSEMYTFKTRPAIVEDFTFLFLTDPQRDNYSGYMDTLEPAMNEAYKDVPDPAFALISGDLVNHSYKSEQWSGFFESIQDKLTKTPLVSTIGNHEYEGNPSDGFLNWESPDPYFTNFKARFNTPENGPAVTGAAGDKPVVVGAAAKILDGTSYSFEYGDVLFIVLNIFDQLPWNTIQPQLDWMKTVVKNSDAKWKIATYHHGLYLGRRDHISHYRDIAKAFDDAGIDLSLSGHDHMYLRTHPMYNDKVVEKGEGTTYITGGSAWSSEGYKFNPSIAGSYTAIHEDEIKSGYHTVHVSKDAISVIAKNRNAVNGEFEVIESYTINQPLPKNLDNWIPPESPDRVEDENFPPLVDGVYQISTAEQLWYMSKNMGTGFNKLPYNGSYKLTNDIDMKNIKGYRPIGDGAGSSTYFTGTFDGNYKVIKNLKIVYDPGWESGNVISYVGLFGYLGSSGSARGVIKNLGLLNVDYSSSISSTGGIVGMNSGGLIENTYVTGRITSTNTFAGGIAGRMRNNSSTSDGEIRNSYSIAVVEGLSEVGGIVGSIVEQTSTTKKSRVENSYATGEVKATKASGAIAGGVVGNINSSIGVVKNNAAINMRISGTSIGKLYGAAHASASITDNIVWKDIEGVDGTAFVAQRGVIGEKAEEDFYQQATFNSLSWNFTDTWKWQTVASSNAKGYPNLQKIASQGFPYPFIDKFDLIAAIESVTGTNAKVDADYTAFSWANFAEALANAQRIANDSRVLQDEIDNALQALQAAITFLAAPGVGDGFTAATLAELRFRIAEIGSGTGTITITDSFDGDDNLGKIVFDGGNITLRADHPVTIKMKGNIYLELVGGALTIGDNITLKQAADNTITSRFIYLTSNPILHVNNAKIISEIPFFGSSGVIVIDNSNAKIHIKNSQVSAEGARTIYSYDAGSVISIENSTVANKETALYRGDYILLGSTVLNGSVGGNAVLHDFRATDIIGSPSPATTVTLTKTGAGIAVTDASYKIFYTTDGSDPTTGIEYKSPFTISKDTVVKAIIKHHNFFGNPVSLHYTISGEPEPEPTDNEFNVWTLGSLDRARKVSEIGSITSAEMYAAKGETTSFQIVVKAPDNEAFDITGVNISNLSGPGGSVIDSSHIDLFREHFIKVGKHTSGGQGGTNNRLDDDWFPDALIPFIDPVTGKAPSASAQYKAIPYTVAAGENMPFWADVNVPSDAAPGNYTGTYTVQTSAGQVTGEVSLNVWNFVMPVKSYLHTSFGIRGEGADKPPGDYATAHDYKRDVNVHKELLRNRINPESGVNPEDEDELIAMGLKSLNTDFWSNADWGATEMDPPPTVDEILAEVIKHDPRLLLYNYTADEIEYIYDNPAYHDHFRSTLKEWADHLHQAGVKQLVVTKPYSDLLTDEDLGGEGKPIVDIYAILNDYYKDNKAVVREAQDKGAMVWTYTALSQDKYSPKWAMDYAPINYRISQGFINQSIGSNGLLYWTINFWSSDPWTSVNASEASKNVPGDGILIYPGEQAGLAGIAPSLRLKVIRDGIYDYDYIEMLKEAGYGEWALEISKGIATDFESWNQSPEALEAARIKLGNKLSEIQDTQLSSNADLSDLKVNGLTVNGFSADVRSYSLNVPNATTSVTITASSTDAGATIELIGGDLLIVKNNTVSNLAVGANTITVTVTAQDGTKKKYSIVVTRANAAPPTDTDNHNPQAPRDEDTRQEIIDHGNGTISVTASMKGDTATASITLQQAQGKSITVTSPIATITLPVGAIDIHTLEQQLGSSAWKLVVTMTELPEQQQQAVAKSIQSSKGTIIGKVIEFMVFAEVDGRKVEVTNFNGIYTPHTVLLDTAVDGRYATVVRIENDGTFTFVPAVFNGKEVTFYSPSNSRYAILEMNKSFGDLQGHWAKEDIERLASKWIVFGTSDAEYMPDRNITRAEFTSLIMRALGFSPESSLSSFQDVSANAWYAGTIEKAVVLGLVKGGTDGNFRPNDVITREEIAIILNKAMSIAGKPLAQGTTTSLAAFTDSDQIAGWAKQEVADAVNSGLLLGMPNGQLQPKESATRAQAAAVILRLLLQADFIN